MEEESNSENEYHCEERSDVAISYKKIETVLTFCVIASLRGNLL